tara:strand:- start:343 stop:1095 length:753 start_codon:yes stop_codon:yes gene_type:complete
MQTKINKLLQVTALTLLSGAVLAGPVDLSPWTVNGTGTWNLQAGNNAVKQTVNGNPTVFHNNQDSQGKALSGTIKVETSSDDDYIGFVLGYNNGDLSNSSADYLLIDWKQLDQNYYGNGLKGLAISQVTGALGDNSGAWSHAPANNVTELQRATTLGSTGWSDNTEYSFDLIFTTSLVEVFVNGAKELSITGTFNNGSFGFYNYSQANVLYAGIEEDIAPPSAVPVPAAVLMFAPALLGFLGLRRRKHAA